MRLLNPLTCPILALSLIGTGCQIVHAPDDVHSVIPVASIVPQTGDTRDSALPSSFTRREVTYADGRKVDWIIVRFNPGDWSWRMLNDPSHPKDVKTWREQQEANLAINGAYFDNVYQPVGFYSQPSTPFATGTRSWPDLDEQQQANGYTGLVTIRADWPYLFYLPDKPQAKPTDDSFLTYPTLVADGRPLVKEDSQKYARRTILAQDATGTTYVISTERGAVSLYEAARWLAEQPENFLTALNLDGGPSTGLSYLSGQERFEIPSVPIPNVITATKIQK